MPNYTSILLPVQEAYTHYTPVNDAFLSVLQNADIHRQQDIWENYIGIAYRRDFIQGKSHWCEFRGYYDKSNFQNLNCINLNYNHTARDTGDDLVEILCDALCAGYYALLQVETFYLSPYINYHKARNIHIIFLYGYDAKEHAFHVADYFDYQYYSYTKVPCGELLRGYRSYQESGLQDFLGIYVFKERKAQKVRAIDNVKICRNLERLLQPVGPDDLYDLNSLPHFLRELEEYVRHTKEAFAPRLFHFLYSHCELMVLRVKYLRNIRPSLPLYLEEESRELFDICGRMRSLVLKSIIRSQASRALPDKVPVLKCLEALRTRYPLFVESMLDALWV